MLGVLPATSDGGPDVAPAKTAAITSWEPHSVDPNARLTAARVGDDFTYVGFSDGEIYFRATVGGTSWSRMDLTDNIGGQLTPRMAVSAIAIDTLESSPSIFVGYAGETGAHTFWCAANNGQFWLEGPLVDDVWAMSVSPFDASQIAIVTSSLTWATVGCGSTWSSSTTGAFDVNFPGAIEALAEGVGPHGARRAWLGDSLGGVYHADDIDAAPSAEAVWTAVVGPGFPRQPVTAISVNREHPEQVWVTFRGLSAADVWATADDGATWTNQRRAFLTTPPGAMAGSLNAISVVPALDLAYVTALIPNASGGTAVSSFWTVGLAQPWSPD